MPGPEMTPEQAVYAAGLGAAQQAIQQARQTIDSADMHFAKRGPGPANEEEVEMIFARRQAVTVLRSLRDAADQVLKVTEDGASAAAFQRRFGPRLDAPPPGK